MCRYRRRDNVSRYDSHLIVLGGCAADQSWLPGWRMRVSLVAVRSRLKQIARLLAVVTPSFPAIHCAAADFLGVCGPSTVVFQLPADRSLRVANETAHREPICLQQYVLRRCRMARNTVCSVDELDFEILRRNFRSLRIFTGVRLARWLWFWMRLCWYERRQQRTCGQNRKLTKRET